MGKVVVTVQAKNDGLNRVFPVGMERKGYLKDIGKVFD